MEYEDNDLPKNRLVPFFSRYKTNRHSTKGPKVTIAIGFVCPLRDKKLAFGALPSIWMASDSQATYDETKRENPNKIRVIDFANGQILVAQADSVEVGDRMIEILRPKAKATKMVDSQTAVKTVRAALLEVRNELLECNKGITIDLEKFFWTEHRLNLLIGYFFNGQPHLYKMNIYRGLYTLVDSFEAIGGGQSLGYFLLKEYAQADPYFQGEFPVAVDVVNKVIENVDGCERPIWVANVIPLPPESQTNKKKNTHSQIECEAIIIPQRKTEMLSRNLRVAYVRNATRHKEELLRAIWQVAGRRRTPR
ncbi:MAG: hypothetical protein ABSH15_15225 [Verrucomicrobiota bacterium]|jgi:hypothetical protein